jgi:dipeptidyl aminopeptidase/acylaminoacyl peptidase
MALKHLRVGLAVALVALAAAVPAEATFPGRNGVIAYVQNGSSGGPGTYYDTHGLYASPPRRQAPSRTLLQCKFTAFVPQDCEITDFYAPSYSANGRRIVFDADKQVGIINADGSGLRLLSAVTSNDGDPAFSPDGKRIVFTGANDHGGTDVYVRRIDGAEPKAIVYDAEEPAWSSRNEIAYVREGNIYAADPKGRHKRFVTSGVSPDWSPDGRRLVLIRPGPNFTFAVHMGRLHVVGARGHGLRALGKRRDISNPVWSPDGRWLAFDGFDLGVHKRRFLPHTRIFEIAPTQIGDEGAFVSSYEATWQPR